MKPVRSLFVTALAAFVFAALPARADDGNKIVKTFPFSDKETKVGVKSGDAIIASFVIKHWPDPDQMAKGEKDLDDKHSVDVEFTYGNLDTQSDYKCHYSIEIPGGADGRPYALADETKTLSKGKVDDTNKVSVKMRTHQYKLAKTIKITFVIWKKT
jgi:hypothetical protein